MVATIIAGMSLSIGSGRAEAFPIPWEAVVAGAEKIAPVVAKNLRIFAEDAASLFESNAKLKPITDEVELASRETQWEGYTSRAEPAAARTAEPASGINSTVGKFVCNTAASLIAQPDQHSWDNAMDKARNEVVALNPVGKPLMLYHDLKEIYDNYESGCICAGTAELAVFIAKQRYCEGGE